MYQCFIKRSERRDADVEGPFNFGTAEERKAFVMHIELGVFWYHDAEEDDWHSWHRGGAWKNPWKPSPADREVVKPEITEEDRL